MWQVLVLMVRRNSSLACFYCSMLHQTVILYNQQALTIQWQAPLCFNLVWYKGSFQTANGAYHLKKSRWGHTYSLNWSPGRRGEGANHTLFIKSPSFSSHICTRRQTQWQLRHIKPTVPLCRSLSTAEIRLIAGLWSHDGAKHGGSRPAVCDLMGYGSIHRTMGLWELQSHGHKSPVLLVMGLWLSID